MARQALIAKPLKVRWVATMADIPEPAVPQMSGPAVLLHFSKST
jgi:hypothetical protein